MPTKFKTKVIFAISILSLGKFLSNNPYVIQSEAAISSTNINELEKFNLSYDLEEKLDKLAKSMGELQKNMNFVLSAVGKNQEELKSLRQMIYQNHPHLVAERKGQQNSKLNPLEVKCERLSTIKSPTITGNCFMLTNADDRLPENCFQVKECHKHVYNIAIPNYSEEAFPVSCDLKTEDSGWTVIQRRQDGSVNFFRNWTEYVEGFGDLNGEFFIGLEKMHALTTQEGAQELYIILGEINGEQRYAKYKTFRIGSRETDYKLTVGNYSGDAGDSFSYHSGNKFSTWDRDNDRSEENCAEESHSGWWHHSCYNINLNGDYLMGHMFWTPIHGVPWGGFRGLYYSLTYTKMMIRTRQY